MNVGIINSITRLHLVGYFYWFILKVFETNVRDKIRIQERGSNSWREKLIQLRSSIGGTLQIILLWFVHEIIWDGHDLQHVWVNHEVCIKHSGSKS